MSAPSASVPYAAPRVSAFYAAYFLVAGVALPFWPLYLQARGLSVTEIGLMLGLTLMLRAAAGPFIGRFADRRDSTRGPLVACALTVLLVAAAFYWTWGFWPIFVVSTVFTLVYAGVLPLGETIALRTVSAESGYGRVRLWGSVSYLIAAAVGGAVLEIDKVPSADLILTMILVTIVVMIAGSFAMPDKRGGSAPPVAPILSVLGDRQFRLMVLATTAIHGAHAVFYGFSTLHWLAAGLSEWVIGLLWVGGVVAEVILFAWNAPLVLLGTAAVAGVVRWSVLALTTEVWALALAQCLHAFTFGAMHLGAMVFIARTVPAGSSNTAQALFAATTNGLGLGHWAPARRPALRRLGRQCLLGVRRGLGLGLHRGAGDAPPRTGGSSLVAAGASRALLQDEAAVAVGAVDGPLCFQVEEHAWMAKRAATAVARDDRIVDLDDLWRVDGHGPFLIVSV